MKEELFGSIMYNGKMIDIDKEDVESLKKIAEELKEKNKIIEEKTENIFNQ